MPITGSSSLRRYNFPRSAYRFVFEALHQIQADLDRPRFPPISEADAHVSGQELLEGIRVLAIEQFGLMAIPVFHQWGIRSTEDFGRLVFELIERGEMRKTERDSLDDFVGLYSFEEVFDQHYQIETRNVFADARHADE